MTGAVPCRLEFAGLTDVGRSRVRNEDCFEIGADLGLAVVCDGMGGHAGGDIASRAVAGGLHTAIGDADPAPAELPERIALIHGAVRRTNRHLLALNRERGYAEGRGMGTTLVGLWLAPGTDTAVVFHVGDSRLYRLRANAFIQITRDHSLYQAWLEGGRRGPTPQRNIILRALGTSTEAAPDVASHPVVPDDLFLLCSDGLSGLVTDDEMRALIDDADDLAAACRALVDAANGKGGHDNITVVLARCRPCPP